MPGQVARRQVAGGKKKIIGKWGIPEKSFQNVYPCCLDPSKQGNLCINLFWEENNLHKEVSGKSTNAQKLDTTGSESEPRRGKITYMPSKSEANKFSLQRTQGRGNSMTLDFTLRALRFPHWPDQSPISR